MRGELPFRRMRRRVLLAVVVAFAGPVALAPAAASAEGLFDFFFGGLQKQQQASPQSSRAVAAVSGPAFCVRGCDGKYFPLMRGNASPAQMCEAFCPASATKVYFGSGIDSAYAADGERYADSENAYAYRKNLRADCTCNGRDPAGLAPVDLTLDSSLRPGDVVATTDGLVAYSGVRFGNGQAAEFIPIASYPGLTADVRARLNEMKVAPMRADLAANAPPVDVAPSGTPLPTVAAPRSDKRAALD